jgi:hypothetical protein
MPSCRLRRSSKRGAGTNTPQGAAYREQFAKIDRREKLIDRDDKGKEFPTPEDRVDASQSEAALLPSATPHGCR